MIHHFVSISTGKDSTAVACVARERRDRRADFRPRLQFCDVDNEDHVTMEHLDYLERVLETPIERLSAYDVPGLIDAAAFERKRAYIRERWPHELRRTRHNAGCKERREMIPEIAKGCRASPERIAALKAWALACDCPEIISPAVPEDRIEAALAALEPSGNAYLDMSLLHGRFPSKMAKFCTDELKLAPMRWSRSPIWQAGGVTVDWIGERALESKKRAARPPLERLRRNDGGTEILYRPIHSWTAAEAFAIAKRHGIKPNPLYLVGAGRVGCWPCIEAQKAEIALVARRSPEKIEMIREWERLVSLVSRQGAGEEGYATFFAADKVPGDPGDNSRAAIDKVVEWSRTGRGGRNFDLINAITELEFEDEPTRCVSRYGLCE